MTLERKRRCLVSNFLLASVVLFLLLTGCISPAAALFERKSAFDLDLASHRCEDETGTFSSGHTEWLDHLNGKRVVFIGDSISRYQYIALAFYLTHGRCPDTGESGYGNIIQAYSYDSWTDFFQKSSAALNAGKEPMHTTERCLCNRKDLRPGDINERRHYVYEDMQGRKIDLMYLQYFTENYDHLQTIVSAGEMVQPTDVLINFGAWFTHHNDSTCGVEPGDPSCPHVSWVCDYYKAEHPFRLWWIGTSPSMENSTEIVPKLPATSHFSDIAARCDIDASWVLDRTAAVTALQPNRKLQHELFMDRHHLHADANHAFNTQFLSRISEDAKDTSKPRNHHLAHIWNRLLGQNR